MHHIDRIAGAIALALATGCAQTPDVDREPVNRPQAPAAASPDVQEEAAAAALESSVKKPRAAAVSFARPVAPPATAGQQDEDLADLTAVVVSYFNTLEYQREFARSFIPRSDVEPDYLPGELEGLQEFFELLQKDKKDRAYARIERMHEDLPSATTNFLLGQRSQSEGRVLDAIAYYEAAVDNESGNGFPNFLRAWQGIAGLHFQLATSGGGNGQDEAEGEAVKPQPDPVDHYAEAQRAFQRTLSLGLVDEKTYGFLGLTLLARNQAMEAETAFRNALMMSLPGAELRQNWLTGLLQSYFKQRRYADAAALVEGFIAETPGEAKWWLLQGNAFIQMGDAKRAAENFQVAYQLGGADADALLILGDIYVNKGLGEDAVDRYLAALDKAPTKAARPLRAADNLLRKGQVDAVARLLDGVETRSADQMDGESRAKMRRLASQVAVRRGDSERQIEILRELIDEDPMDGDALILLGESLGKDVKTLRELEEEAERAFAALVAEAEQEGESLPVAPVPSGEAAAMRLAVEEAYQVLETAAALEGFEARAKVSHAQLLVGEKRYAEAAALLKSSLQYQEKELVRRFLESVEAAAQRAGS